MSDTENNSQILEKVLPMLHIIDMKLNDVFKNATVSFSKSSTLFKGIFKPLQTHWVNTNKITSIYGTASINMSSIKEGMSIISEKLQFHDVVEQHVKHIRDINAHTIRELSSRKSAVEHKRATDGYVKLIAQSNGAQLASIAHEYKSYCEKLDESLNSVVRYLSDLNDFTKLLGNNNSPDTMLLIKENAALAEQINLFISSFRADYSYRDAFQKSITEVGHCLATVSSLIKTNEKNRHSIRG